MSKVGIVEVGPRDGLQNEAKALRVEIRAELIRRLVNSGVQRIETGAFVSPKWVPQMAKSDAVLKRVAQLQKKPRRFSSLVPNRKGMELALNAGAKDIAIFGAASESFSQKNINCSITESFKRFEQVMSLAKKNMVPVRGYLSTAFGCPYEGKVSEAKVVKLVGKYLEMGVYELSIGDTIGVATPKQVRSVLKKIESAHGLKKVAMHFHDTRGTALANVLASLDSGVKIFDSSIGGLGGCPYAKGASGNLATEDLVYMLHGMGFKTGIDLKALVKTSLWVEKKIGRSLPSRVSKALHF